MTLFIVIFAATIIDIAHSGALTSEPVPFTLLDFSYYNDCKGNDGSNFTMIHAHSFVCQSNGVKDLYTYLIQAQPNQGQPNVNALRLLTTSAFLLGANRQLERLLLITSGSLQGKYVYTKTVILFTAYLKTCSSVLGYSYLVSKSSELMISDRLDMDALISATGAYKVFRKGCTTVCKGIRYAL